MFSTSADLEGAKRPQHDGQPAPSRRQLSTTILPPDTKDLPEESLSFDVLDENLNVGLASLQGSSRKYSRHSDLEGCGN